VLTWTRDAILRLIRDVLDSYSLTNHLETSSLSLLLKFRYFFLGGIEASFQSCGVSLQSFCILLETFNAAMLTFPIEQRKFKLSFRKSQLTLRAFERTELACLRKMVFKCGFSLDGFQTTSRHGAVNHTSVSILELIFKSLRALLAFEHGRMKGVLCKSTDLRCNVRLPAFVTVRFVR